MLENPNIDPMDWLTSLDCTQMREDIMRKAVENLCAAMREHRKMKGKSKLRKWVGGLTKTEKTRTEMEV